MLFDLANHVANLRAVHVSRPEDDEVNALIRDLIKDSAEFRDLWQRHDVAVLRAATKTLLHPEVGRLDLDCEVLLAPSGEQKLILFTGRPGTDTADRLKLLRVLGHQRFADQPEVR